MNAGSFKGSSEGSYNRKMQIVIKTRSRLLPHPAKWYVYLLAFQFTTAHLYNCNPGQNYLQQMHNRHIFLQLAH